MFYGKHWLYHSLLYVHVPLAQVVDPVNPLPPHCAYSAAPLPELDAVVVDETPPVVVVVSVPDARLITTLYALTDKTALVPVKGSVPAPILFMY